MKDFNVKKVIALEDYMRIDKCIADLTDLSRSKVSKLIRGGCVKINDIFQKDPSIKVFKGDSIDIYLKKESENIFKPVDLQLKVYFENEWYAVIEKPAGISVHPGDGEEGVTLINGLFYLFDIEMDNDNRPGIIHRLDKDTSGLLIVAKKLEAREKFQRIFKDRKIIKCYQCVCVGQPIEKIYEVSRNIVRHPVSRHKMTTSELNGRYAYSKITVRERYDSEFFCDVAIETGRTHQIRVHLAYLGFPVIGDNVYGSKRAQHYPIARQALHAGYLNFTCPFSGDEKRIVSDIPLDMCELVKYLKKN